MEAHQLKEWRERMKITQEELAELLQVAPNTVSRWELGQRAIPGFLERALKDIERERE